MRKTFSLTLLLAATAVLGSCFEKIVTDPCPAGHSLVAGGGYCVAGDLSTVRDMNPPCNDCDMAGHADMTQKCTSSVSCGAGSPVCSGGVCGSCQLDADGGSSSSCVTFHPSTPLCGPGGACVQCLNKDDCASIHLTCDTTKYQCGPCKVNADCKSGLCNSATNQCADVATQFYVDNANAQCNDAGGCSFGVPCCKVQAGLDASAAAATTPVKPVIIFPGHGYAEGLSAAPSRNNNNAYVASAIGVGQPVIKPGAGATLTLGSATAAAHVAVTFDGITFDESMAASGLSCTGDMISYADTALTIVRSTIANGTTVGLTTSNQCTLTMDADTVSNNKGGGVSLSTTNFTLTNLLVSNNGKADSTVGAGDGSGFGGILVASTGQSRGQMILFNLTAVNNLDSALGTTPAGIACSVISTLGNTVAFQNQGPTGAQITALCMADHSAYPSASGTNQDLATCTAAQLFVNAAGGLYQPKTGGATPCSLIGDGAAAFMSVAAPSHDLAGNPRPSAGSFDIGAYQH